MCFSHFQKLYTNCTHISFQHSALGATSSVCILLVNYFFRIQGISPFLTSFFFRIPKIVNKLHVYQFNIQSQVHTLLLNSSFRIITLFCLFYPQQQPIKLPGLKWNTRTQHRDCIRWGDEWNARPARVKARLIETPGNITKIRCGGEKKEIYLPIQLTCTATPAMINTLPVPLVFGGQFVCLSVASLVSSLVILSSPSSLSIYPTPTSFPLPSIFLFHFIFFPLSVHFLFPLFSISIFFTFYIVFPLNFFP